MAEEPERNEDDELFDGLLEKRGDAWLMKRLEALGVKLPPKENDPTSTRTPAPSGGNPFETFLSGELAGVRKENATLRERLDAALDLLTTEQRVSLKSLLSGAEGDPRSPQPKRLSAPKEPEKRKGFLRSL